MVYEIGSDTVLESRPAPPVKVSEPWYTIQQFRFLPASYLEAVGNELDPGMDQLVYLRMFIEEETEDALL